MAKWSLSQYFAYAFRQQFLVAVLHGVHMEMQLAEGGFHPDRGIAIAQRGFYFCGSLAEDFFVERERERW